MAQGDEDAPVWVKLLTRENLRIEGSPSSYEPGTGFAKMVRDFPLAWDSTYSDARLDGTQHLLHNEDCFEDGICVAWGAVEVAGPEGTTWTGWYHEIDDDDTDGVDDTSWHFVLTGTGPIRGPHGHPVLAGRLGAVPRRVRGHLPGRPARGHHRPHQGRRRQAGCPRWVLRDPDAAGRVRDRGQPRCPHRPRGHQGAQGGGGHRCGHTHHIRHAGAACPVAADGHLSGSRAVPRGAGLFSSRETRRPQPTRDQHRDRSAFTTSDS